MTWDIVINIISGLAICIPLVIKLVQTIHNYAQEKNWAAIVKLVLEYMEMAEELYENGETKKDYVMMAVEESAEVLNYNYDEEAKAKVSKMIDDICKASKIINA